MFENLGEPQHKRRYERSFEILNEHNVLSISDVLNLGEGREFGKAIAEQAKSYFETSSDLRFSLPCLADNFDLVLCMETIEHIKDTEAAARDTFQFDGIRMMLKEANRVLKKGGKLFLSTPNICAWSSLARMASGCHPFMFKPHNRELAPGDVRYLMREAGFTSYLWTEDVWGQHKCSANKLVAAEQFVRACNGNTADRGDIIFAIGVK